MNTRIIAAALISGIVIAGPGMAADDTKVRNATGQVERGAKQIGEGEVTDGVKDTAKGVGNTVVEGSKYTGEKFKESGQAAEPQAKNAWQHTKDGAKSFGRSVKNFFTTLF